MSSCFSLFTIDVLKMLQIIQPVAIKSKQVMFIIRNSHQTWAVTRRSSSHYLRHIFPPTKFHTATSLASHPPKHAHIACREQPFCAGVDAPVPILVNVLNLADLGAARE